MQYGKSFALNGNHEMYSGGNAYFNLLPIFGQSAISVINFGVSLVSIRRGVNAEGTLRRVHGENCRNYSYLGCKPRSRTHEGEIRRPRLFFSYIINSFLLTMVIRSGSS